MRFPPYWIQPERDGCRYVVTELPRVSFRITFQTHLPAHNGMSHQDTPDLQRSELSTMCLRSEQLPKSRMLRKTKQLPKRSQVYLQTKYQVTDFCGLPQVSFSPGRNHHRCACPGQFYKKLTATNKPEGSQFSPKKHIKDNSASSKPQ